MTCRTPALRRIHFIVALLILHESTFAAAAEDLSTTTRVRSEHPVIAAAIVNAGEHSITFHSMLDAIEKTDGIVYVREGTCKRRLRACLAAVHRAPPVRFVYIKVDTRRSADCRLMVSIGHELQHALEVLNTPSVIDNLSLTHFYLRTGATRDGTKFENRGRGARRVPRGNGTGRGDVPALKRR
jgi:hypothetical protein